MPFELFNQLPNKPLKFIADGYSTYQLVSQQGGQEMGWKFDFTQVISLSNDDAFSKEFRWAKCLNRTFKSSYRITCGYGTEDGDLFGVSLLGCVLQLP